MTLKELIDTRHPFGVPVRIAEYMAGGRKAVWDKETLFVSPAMASLLADPDSIESVACAIEVVVIPKYDVFSEPLPMMEYKQ